MLPRLGEVPWRDLDSLGVGGTELGLDDNSVGSKSGNFVDFRLLTLCEAKKKRRNVCQEYYSLFLL